jgi:GH18 family chitinase
MLSRQTCPSTWMQRRVAYYETWADTRSCDKFQPEDIPVHALTHLNIAFGTLGSDFKIGAVDEAMIRRVTKLKLQNRALEVYISLGGWAFNDPGPTRTRFSDMVSTISGRQTFTNSVMDFLDKYGLDGIDIGENSTFCMQLCELIFRKIGNILLQMIEVVSRRIMITTSTLSTL